jgi:hypothetical protein
MTDPARSDAPEWRIVSVAPTDEGNVLNAAVVRFLNDNSPASKRVLARLEACVDRLLRARGVRVPAAGPAAGETQGADGPKV